MQAVEEVVMGCRRSVLLVVAGLAGVAHPVCAVADTYICKTANGETVSGPEPQPECAGRPMRRIHSNGWVEEIIPPTPDQRQREEEEAKRQRAEAERRKQQMQKDYALLEAYKSVEQIEAARNRDLAALQARIVAAQKALGSLVRERERLREEEKFYERRELPATLKKAIESNEVRRATLDKVIAETRAAMERVNEEYDAKVKRFLELAGTDAGDDYDAKVRRFLELTKPPAKANDRN
jgi:hypothetical protein